MSTSKDRNYSSGEPIDFQHTLEEERGKVQQQKTTSIPSQQPSASFTRNNPAMPQETTSSALGDDDNDDNNNDEGGSGGSVLQLLTGDFHSYEEQHNAIDFKALLREERRKARLLKAKSKQNKQDDAKDDTVVDQVQSMKDQGKQMDVKLSASSSVVPRSQEQSLSAMRQKHPQWPPQTSGETPLSFQTEFDLQQYLLSSQPSSLYYIPNIWNDTNDTTSSSSSSTALWNWLDSLPHDESGLEAWKTLKYGKRRVAMMDIDGKEGSLSGPLQDIVTFLVQSGIFPTHTPPNHVLLNDYFDPTQGILPHTDGPLYAPRTATFSLGTNAPVLLTFTPRRRELNDDAAKVGGEENRHGSSSTTSSDASSSEKEIKTLELVLHPQSLVIFQDDLYTNYCHGIEMIKDDGLEDVIVETTSTHCLNAPPNTRIPRGPRRMSLTFRHKYP